MTFRHWIIRLALRLQWPPFIWLFRFYYWLALQSTRIFISRVEGVRSIYLTGSWVKRDIIYGLSDIDFKVLVSGKKNQKTYASIRGKFSFLHRFFPMLGPPDEKGIYFLDTFGSDYRHYPLMQHLFDARFFGHQLQWGENLMAQLPIRHWKELDRGECAFSRLKDWIERIHILAVYDGFSTQQKQHLFFKALSDVALLALRIKSPEYHPSRRIEILQRICPEMETPHRQLMENLILENQNLYATQLNSQDENFQLFKKMVLFCSEKISTLDSSSSSSIKLEGASNIRCIEDHATEDTLKGFSPNIRTVKTIHWPHLPLNPFDMHFFNTPAYLLEFSQPITLEELRALRAFYRKNLRNKAAVLLQEYPRILSSVDSDLVDHWGSFPGSSDILNILLGNTPCHTLTRLEEERIETRLHSFQEQLAATLADPEFGRMSLSAFAPFLFNALRVLIFGHEFSRGKWRWLVTASEVADFLINHTPMTSAFLDELVKQFESARLNSHPFDERLLAKSRALMNKMLEIVQNGESWDSLREINDLADKKRLSISLAIITANRPKQLERCLNSIAHLVRQPQELIIVDSGEDSLTQKAIEKSQIDWPVQYLDCAQDGVACARNLAVSAAKGEIIAFVDDDICIDPDWLEKLERVFLRDPKIGMASGAILNLKCGRDDRVSKYMAIVEKI